MYIPISLQQLSRVIPNHNSCLVKPHEPLYPPTFSSELFHILKSNLKHTKHSMPEPEYIELSTLGLEEHEAESSTQTRTSFLLSRRQVALVLVRLGVEGDTLPENSGQLSPETWTVDEGTEYMLHKINDLPIQEATSIIRNAIADHQGDVNFPHEDYLLLERLIHASPQNESEEAQARDTGKIEPEKDQYPLNDTLGDQELAKLSKSLKHKPYLRVVDWDLQVRLEAALIAYHSPYPEIRGITDPFDDPTIPVDTLRVYVIGLFWTLIGSFINNFFVHRLPSIRLNLHTVQLLLYPSGKLFEYIIPHNYKVNLLGLKVINLNPGPWSFKEMMLATIIYSCALGTPYLIYNVVVMKLDKFYDLKWVSWLFQILLALSTQCLGFGFAGITRRVCVYPAKALWPTILPTIALNRAIMKNDIQAGRTENSVYGWRMSRYSFFYVAFILSFLYNWLPSVFFKALSTFNWPTWIVPLLLHLTNVTGLRVGLGLNPWPTFDWNVLDAIGCLTIPFYTYANQYLGAILAFGVIMAVYYTNNNWTAYIPINTNVLYNGKGDRFKVSDILDAENRFDNEKYQKVGPPYFSAANLVLYGAYFCLYPFAILYHFTTEWQSMKNSFINTWKAVIEPSNHKDNSRFGRDANDPHCKMMSKYEEVPNWWFTLILLLSTIMAIICVVFYPVETPIWGIFFTIAINFFFLIPITAIASVTGFSFGLNVLVELIVGYAIPNSGLALLTLKAYGYNIDSQASNYITDQKLAHYAKIPSRAIFKGQMLATLLNVVVALAVTNWQIANIQDLCDPEQKDKLSCPGATTYFFSSVQYGVIGPAKVFSGLYPMLKWCFLLGVLLVIPCALFKKLGPIKLTRYFQPTVIIGGFLVYAPMNLLYLTGGLYLSYLFMYHIKRNYPAWWEKYNYVLTSALSAGVAMSAVMIFLFVQYFDVDLQWWGNTVISRGVEGGHGQKTWLSASSAPDGYFGLRKGNYP